MKYLLLFLCVSFFVQVSYGQGNTFPDTGNVGIGITDPTRPLTVINHSSGENDNAITVSIKGEANIPKYGQLFITGDSDNNKRITLGFNTLGNYGFITSYNLVNGSIPLSLNPIGGNVLIGKTTQANTSYKLDVNGNIRANEVVVNTTGADFVFDSTYQLTSLDSLKSYIDRYHHLPGISSAAQMQKDGMDIGTFCTQLLKRNEELTLYLIRQDQALAKQQKINENLSQQLKEIKEEIKAIKKQVKSKN